jgi:hypothetical protein
VAKPEKRFWIGDPDVFEEDDDVGGCLSPDDNGDVHLKKGGDGSQPKRPKRRRTDGRTPRSDRTSRRKAR